MTKDTLSIVPIRDYGDDSEMEELRKALSTIRKQLTPIKSKENRDAALEALSHFELWMAVALREDRSK